MKEVVLQAFEESAEVKRRFVADYADRIVLLAQLIVRALRAEQKLLFFGNGGSATDASHLAAEFVGRYHRDRRPYPALALGTDMAAVTCIANDYAFDEIFARQVRGHGRKGDIAIAISTSGNSPNVLKGVAAARDAGLVEHAFIVPSTVTARIQESHITLGHVLCDLIDRELIG